MYPGETVRLFYEQSGLAVPCLSLSCFESNHSKNHCEIKEGLWFLFLFVYDIYVVDTQWKRLYETLPLSIHNKIFFSRKSDVQ